MKRSKKLICKLGSVSTKSMKKLLFMKKRKMDASYDLIPGLPYDLAFRCLVRLDFLTRPLAKCVCKSWNNALNDVEFYKYRKINSLSEECVFALLENWVRSEKKFCFLDLENKTWKKLPLIPEIQHCFIPNTTFSSSLLHVSGYGIYAINAKHDIFRFDPFTVKWSNLHKPMELLREDYACIAIHDSIFVVGGYCYENDQRTNFHSAQTFSVKDNIWKTLPPPPSLFLWLCCLDSAVINNKIYLHYQLGELDEVPALVYDFMSQTWESNFPIALKWSDYSVVIDDQFYSVTEESSMPVFYRFDGSSQTWHPVASPSIPKLYIDGVYGSKGKCFMVMSTLHGRFNKIFELKLKNLDELELGFEISLPDNACLDMAICFV